MATATYDDCIARRPDMTTPEETVEAYLADVSAEIAARCEDRGTTYAALVEAREDLVRRIECAAVLRICGRGTLDGISQDGLRSFSQSVGDHRWELNYSASANTSLLREEWKMLGLAGQQIGWVGIPWYGGEDD